MAKFKPSRFCKSFAKVSNRCAKSTKIRVENVQHSKVQICSYCMTHIDILYISIYIYIWIIFHGRNNHFRFPTCWDEDSEFLKYSPDGFHSRFPNSILPSPEFQDQEKWRKWVAATCHKKLLQGLHRDIGRKVLSGVDLNSSKTKWSCRCLFCRSRFEQLIVQFGGKNNCPCLKVENPPPKCSHSHDQT